MLTSEQKKYRILLFLSTALLFLIPAVIHIFLMIDIIPFGQYHPVGNFIFSAIKDISSISSSAGIALIVISAILYDFKKSLFIAIPLVVFNLILDIINIYFNIKGVKGVNSYTILLSNVYNYILSFAFLVLMILLTVIFTRIFRRNINKEHIVFILSATTVFALNIVIFFANSVLSLILDKIFIPTIFNWSDIEKNALRVIFSNLESNAFKLLIMLCTGVIYYFIEKRIEAKKLMNTNKFTGKAQIYAEYRPSYPTEFIDYLYNDVGFNKNSCIADIGSGTGILSKLLLERGSVVYCVEPNKDMRKLAKKYLSDAIGSISINATAEKTELTDKSIDFVTVAQAFHWFNSDMFKKECQRILKPNGKIVLVWNSRVKDNVLVTENDALCRKFCPNFVGFSGGSSEYEDKIHMFFKDGIYDFRTFNNDRKLTLKSFIGGSLSSSYAPVESDENYKPFIEGLTELFYKYSKNGIFMLPNITKCYIGRV
jgi:SAM-dependent methyltransferase